MSHITAHMIVKNEDQWVYFAIQSVLPYVDHFLITDTGSSDKTCEIIESIQSPKIHFSKTVAKNSTDVTKIRAKQLKETNTDWIWIVDGDEIYPNKTAIECLEAISTNKYEGVVVRRYDLLGDIYHRQLESIGQYDLFGHQGHLLVRLINKNKIKGLKYLGDYPNEGFFDGTEKSILTRNPADWYYSKNYLYHAMYLRRSSLGGNLAMLNRSKYKIETGIPVQDNYPEVFDEMRPAYIPSPFFKRGLVYELASSIITPIKNLKRKLL